MATYPRPASRHRILLEGGLVLLAGQFPETNSPRSFELKSRHTPLHYFLDFFPGIMGCAVAISCYIPHVQKIEVTLPYLGVHSRSPMVDDRLVTYAKQITSIFPVISAVCKTAADDYLMCNILRIVTIHGGESD